MEYIERAALEMHRLQYVRNKQQLKGPHSWYSGLLNFARVREALRFKMKAELDRQVSKAEASAELNKVMSAQAKVFKMMRRIINAVPRKPAWSQKSRPPKRNRDGVPNE
jgi:hypothetical protein